MLVVNKISQDPGTAALKTKDIERTISSSFLGSEACLLTTGINGCQREAWKSGNGSDLRDLVGLGGPENERLSTEYVIYYQNMQTGAWRNFVRPRSCPSFA